MALTACLTILSADWAEALVAQSAAKMIEIVAQKVRFFTEFAGCFIFTAPAYCPLEGVAHILTKFSFHLNQNNRRRRIERNYGHRRQTFLIHC